ncbi:MAG: hypothetical protein WBW73_27225 [Rhodoplanes sp.]
MSKAVFATLIALATIGAGISDANAAPRKHIRQARHSKVQETELPAKAGKDLDKIMNICRCSDIPKGAY